MTAEDNFCGTCGQENHTHKLPVRHFVVELLSGLFNFDTKLLRTLRDLFWPPGLVIREFNANKRARYVHPLRLYLFTSVLFFLFLAWTTANLENDEGPVLVVSGDLTETNDDPGLTVELENGSTVTDSMLTELSARPQVTDAMIDSMLVGIGSEPSVITRIVVRMAMNASGNSVRKEAFIARLFAAFSKLLFLLLPIFALLLYLLHRRSGYYYTEHLVFALYFHTVAFLFIGIRMLIGQFMDIGILSPAVIIFVAFYLVWAVRTVYGKPWSRSILNIFVLLFLYGILIVLGFGAAAVMGALQD